MRMIRLVLSYNGEIYNYLELRKELKLYNWKFKTSSDIEVLANSWKQWGYKMFQKIKWNVFNIYL